MSALGFALENARVLDLFAGSGALGLEALSRGASSVLFVERSRGALSTLRKNIELLGAEADCQVIAGDALAYLNRCGPEDFDLALADPPYEKGLAGKLLEIFEEKGFAQELWVEHRSSEEMPAVPGLLQRRYGDTTLSIVSRRE
jgi:16S rRNA (guanine966-N2)-methyltransferase